MLQYRPACSGCIVSDIMQVVSMCYEPAVNFCFLLQSSGIM